MSEEGRFRMSWSRGAKGLYVPDHLKGEAVRRLMARVEKKKNGCWIWTGAKIKTGYGELQFRRMCQAPVMVHRLSWALFHGDVQKSQQVLHKCDTPACVNPEHLFLGTQTDNNHDRHRKGRTASGDRNGSRTHPERNSFVRNGGSGLRGEDSPTAKLTDKQVSRIRRMMKRRTFGLQHRIAVMMGVTDTTIWRIANGLQRKER
jgi:hypothetical protein